MRPFVIKFILAALAPVLAFATLAPAMANGAPVSAKAETPAPQSVEIRIPAVTVQSGTPLTAPVMINAVDNLAGIKLVLNYDENVLEFIKAEKTKKTNSLMHVVNSKNPGRIIVVMAGARGIKGKDFSIINLNFNTLPCTKNKCDADLQISEAQLMSDQLKDIVFSREAGQVTVVSEKSDETTHNKPQSAK